MQLGMIGLGRMGGNIVRRLTRHGHRCVVFDQNPKAIEALVGDNAVGDKDAAGKTSGAVSGAKDLADLVRQMDKPRAVWLMLPHGPITESTVQKLAAVMEAGDIIIDGGNSFFKDDVRRAQELKAKNIHYVDCGTSGGVWGLERGYCMMIGGDKQIVDHLDPIFAAMAPGAGKIDKTPRREGRDPRVEQGYMYCGPAGAGRFVKMVHNGIEYGLMQAYAEGFEVMQQAISEQVPAERRFDLDLADIAEVWRRGSVISSWLLDLTAQALAGDPKLDGYSGFVEDSGEGRWTIEAAIEEAVPANVLSASLYARFRSREKENISDKLLSAMRHAFGGHLEPKGEK